MCVSILGAWSGSKQTCHHVLHGISLQTDNNRLQSVLQGFTIDAAKSLKMMCYWTSSQYAKLCAGMLAITHGSVDARACVWVVCRMNDTKFECYPHLSHLIRSPALARVRVFEVCIHMMC